jgi:hypothetical protein
LKTIIPYRYSRAQLVLLIFLIQVWDSPTVLAQRSLTTFGQVLHFRTESHPRHLIAGDFNGDGRNDLGVVFDDHVAFKYRDSSGFRTATLKIDGGIVEVIPAKLNADKRSDLIVITSLPPMVQIFLARPRDLFQRVFQQRLEGTIDHLLVADINSDGKPDILLYGKKHLGISLLLGKGSGAFQHQQLLLPEYSFGVLTVADLNTDKVPDVIGTDWLSNDIMVFSGFGKLKYGNPVRIPGDSEPAFLRAEHLSDNLIAEIIAAYPDEHRIKIYAGSEDGTFHLTLSKEYQGDVLGLSPADVNSDGHADISLLTSRGLLVELNDGRGGIGSEAEFAAGRAPASFILFPEGKTRSIAAAILDTTHASVRYIFNSREEAPGDEENYYATGLNPGAILETDMNGDQNDDILVANAGSRSIGLFLGSRGTSYTGQISFESVIPVHSLRHVSTNDSLVTLVGTSAIAESIVVLSINPTTFSHRVITLPTQGIPDILYARTDTATDRLYLFAMEYPQASAAGQLIGYEQISATRFVERTYRSLSHDPIIGAAMSDIDHDSYPDLIFASYNASQHHIDLTVARGNAHEEFGNARRIASLETRDFPRLGLWCADINGDGQADVILNVDAPENTLYLFLGKNDSTLSPVVPQLRGEMRIENRNDLQVIPHGPGHRTELIVNNSALRMLQSFTVREDGIVTPTAKLFGTEGLGGFYLREKEKNGSSEIVITDRAQGELRVVRMGGGR